MPIAFTEIGLGNPTFINTEVEYDDGTEVRSPGFVRFASVQSLYSRLWLGKTVYILSTNHGFQKKQKSRPAFKCVVGISGELAA